LALALTALRPANGDRPKSQSEGIDAAFMGDSKCVRQSAAEERKLATGVADVFLWCGGLDSFRRWRDAVL